MKKVSKFLSLSLSEKTRLVRAWCILIMARAALVFLPFSVIRRLTAGKGTASLPLQRGDIQTSSSPFQRGDIQTSSLPLQRGDIQTSSLPLQRGDIQTSSSLLQGGDIQTLFLPLQGGGQEGDGVEYAWAVAVASRYVPGATCLVQAMALQYLLRRDGHPALMHIGVNKDEMGKLKAHAWVESRGKVLIGGSNLSSYTRLLALG